MDRSGEAKPIHKKYRILVWESMSSIAGGQRFALNIADKLKNKFHVSFIVPSKGPLSSELDSMEVNIQYIETGTYQRGKKGLADIVRFIFLTPSILITSYKAAKKADLIYANSAKIFLWSAVTGYFAKVPVIWHMHNILTDRKSRLLLELLGNLNSVKKVIAVSYAVKNQFSYLKSKTDVVYNGIDTYRFRITNSSDKSVFHYEGVKKIGIIAYIIPQKGHDTLIKAIRLVRKKVPVKLYIVGAPADGNTSYKNRLQYLSKKLDIEDDIIFVGHRPDIPEILNSLDLLAIPSSAVEACPLAALEALACGIPVVGSHLGGTPELIEDGKTGYIFRAGDESDLAEKMICILGNPDLHHKMKINCRETAKKRFDLGICYEKIESILISTLQTPG